MPRTSKAKKEIDKQFGKSPKEFKRMTGQSQKDFGKQFSKMLNKRKAK